MLSVSAYLSEYTRNAKNETLAGLTTALALVPEVVAFALLAHISPIVGIGSAFVICLITSMFGGRPGMISGAAGSVAVVIVSLVAQHGIEYLFPAVILMGLIQAVDALHKLTERYHRAGKTLHLRHLSPDCRQLLSNAGALIDVNVEDDPLYTVAGAEQAG